MRIKALDSLGDRQPLILKEASVVLIEDRNGTIVAAAVDLPDQMGVMVVHAHDKDFNNVLRQLGVSQLTICEDFQPQSADHMLSLPVL